MDLDNLTTFCSLDLEFTGFDPEKDSILEVGFVIFQIQKGEIEILEEWSQVFNPHVKVHSKIYGLTGLTEEQLSNGADFIEYKDFLQDKLGNIAIVAHNPTLDIKFLEAQGLTLTGPQIDTLALVQFILPTNKSYNLENLSSFLGVKEQNSHRALDDAKSTIGVFKELLKIYCAFSYDLKNKILKLLEKSSIEWKSLFFNIDKFQFTNVELFKRENANSIIDYNDSLVKFIEHSRINNKKYIIGVNSSNLAYQLWSLQFSHSWFGNDELLSKNRFSEFLDKVETNEEIRFAAKILVWLGTNWQTKYLLDLNVSFFGGQFIDAVNGGDNEALNSTTDLGSIITTEFAYLPDVASLYPNYEIVLYTIEDFEEYIVKSSSEKASPSQLGYKVKALAGENFDSMPNYIQAVQSIDLFFGLVYLMLSKNYSADKYVTFEVIAKIQPYYLNQIVKAAQNLDKKLNNLLLPEDYKEIKPKLEFITSFFEGEGAGKIKWIENTVKGVHLHSADLDLGNSLEDFAYKPSLILSMLENEKDEEFLKTRLKSDSIKTLNLNRQLNDTSRNYNLFAYESGDEFKNVFDLLVSTAFPSVVVFGSQASVKNFYDQYYKELLAHAKVYAQGYSGGGNKIFRNFGIQNNTILLASANFIAQQSLKICPKTIILAEEMIFNPHHPYIEALIANNIKNADNILKSLSSIKFSKAFRNIKSEKLKNVYATQAQIENYFKIK